MRGTKAGLPAGGRDDIPKCYLCGAGKSICFALLRELWYHDVQGRGSCGGVVCLYLALPGRFLVHGMYQRHCASAGGPPEWKRRQVHPEPAAGVLSLSGGGGRQIRGAATGKRHQALDAGAKAAAADGTKDIYKRTRTKNA